MIILSCILSILFIIAIVLIVFLDKYYDSKKPQNNCLHDMEVIKTREDKSCTEYLSTCKKCGYQKNKLYCGLNNT